MVSILPARARSRRSASVLGATALSVAVMAPLGGTAIADSHVQNLDPACRGLTDSVGFADISFLAADTQEAINCLYNYDITQGRSGTTYVPADAVKRYEMALFISRAIDYIELASEIDVVDAGDAQASGFGDVGGLTQEARSAIDRLTELQIVQGKSAAVYDPYASITRRDMARFINRIQTYVIAAAEPAAAYDGSTRTAEFADVADTLPGSEDIYALQSAGIVQGHVSGLYEPYQAVRRDHMALYIMRHIADNIEEGFLDTIADFEAPLGFTGTVTVEDIDKELNVFLGNGNEFWYDDNDAFTIGGETATFTDFEAALSRGDDVTVTGYRHEMAEQSTFDLDDVNPAVPSVTAVASDVAGDENDITVTITPGAGDWTTLVLQHGVGAEQSEVSLTAQDDADAEAPGVQVLLPDLAAGPHSFRAAAEHDGDRSDWSADVPLDVAEPSDVQAPTPQGVVLERNSSNGLLLDGGDVIRVAFNEPLRPLVGGETVRVRDEDGTTADIVNVVGDSYFDLSEGVETIDGVEYAPAQLLRITVGTPSVSGGETPGVDLPARITTQSGIADAAGNAWQIPAEGLVIPQP